MVSSSRKIDWKGDISTEQIPRPSHAFIMRIQPNNVILLLLWMPLTWIIGLVFSWTRDYQYGKSESNKLFLTNDTMGYKL
jgi:hypothetical protein